MIEAGDIYLFHTENGGEIAIKNGVPVFDSGLETAVYISLFSERGFWGNDILEQSEKVESELESILSQTLTNQVRLDAIEICKASLKWMLNDGVAREIIIDASIPQVECLLIELEIVQPDFNNVAIQYQINWGNEFSSPAFFNKR